MQEESRHTTSEPAGTAGPPEDEALDRDTAAGGAPVAAERGPLLPGSESERFRSRWHEIQASFVDRPQEAVEEADALVSELMRSLTDGFAAERRQLEAHWSQGDDVSTEELRVALTRYRSFFGRLLSA